ncbi:MAG: hypothetical protein SCM11_05435, partial [Bacillota bacterium]|nr:hypothetical protein [Bacillota bacterium]
VMRRWEDVRAQKWLTEEQKLALQNLAQEHILLINEHNDYELVSYDQITGTAGGNKEVIAFIFERNDERYVVYWHASGSGNLKLSLDAKDVILQKELGSEPIPFAAGNGAITIPVGGRCYLRSSLSREQLAEAFVNAQLR